MKITLEELSKRLKSGQSSLNLSWCHLTNDDVSMICNFLKSKPSLTRLDLSRNKVDANGVVSLSLNTTLKALQLSNNKIGDDGAKILSKNTTLSKLVLSHSRIKMNGAIALASNTTLRKLHLWGNSIGQGGADALAKNKSLTTLDIGFNKLQNEGAKILAINSVLTKLIIARNEIKDSGAKALAMNDTLTKLDVSSNKIKSEGLVALVENTTLRSLDISYNNIFDKDAGPLVNVIKNNTTLLELHHSFIYTRIIETIKKTITRNHVLLYLTTINYARLIAQAQRSDNCLLGTIPIEVAGLINNHIVGQNHFSFFMQQIGKRPSTVDLDLAKQMAN